MTPVSPASRVLAVVTDKELGELIAAILAEDGHQVSWVSDGEEALELLSHQIFQLIVLDLQLSSRHGLEILDYAQKQTPTSQVVAISDDGSADAAAQAMGRGAFELIKKPLNPALLRLTVKRALEKTSFQHAFDYLRHEQPYVYRLEKLVAQSPAMQQILEQVKRVAPTDVTVMLTGESGTGKSLVAGSIHTNSERRDFTLVTVNCAALTETILESELFGHEKGAFTGAHKARTGRIQQAHGGTLFLDEVADMTLATQAKVLRAIEDKVIQRVGGSREIKVDVRIIAATNRDLSEAVADKSFREDLFYRLNVAPIHIPPLRERREDIPPLAEKFLRRTCRELKRPLLSLSPAAHEVMGAYNWPGNIREIRNAIERAVLFTAGPDILPSDLGLSSTGGAGQGALLSETLDLKTLERRAIEIALEQNDWVQSRAAVLLGITPRTLVYKIKKHEIDHPRLQARRR